MPRGNVRGGNDAAERAPPRSCASCGTTRTRLGIGSSPDVCACVRVRQLARKFRNDKSVGFGCVGAARQHDFLRAYGLTAAELPALVAVKGGKRPRAATMPRAGGAALEASAMSAFVESVIDGRTTFSRLADGLPELEAPYLLDADDAAPKDEV